MPYTQDFLQQVVDKLIQSHPNDMHRVHLVFPNRRAGLFFRQKLAARLDRPIWEPSISSVEEFLASFSQTEAPDTLSQIIQLYEIFTNHVPELNERLDRFFFWGQMLLRDFEDVDQHLVDAQLLFTVLVRQKELEQQFAILEDENKRLLELFWGTFGEHLSTQQQEFIKLWEALPGIYADFRRALTEKNQATVGMMARQLAESSDWVHALDKEVWFVGLNALTLAEERVLARLLEAGKAKVFWDVDALYMDQSHHEAGYFLRQYREKEAFTKTFPNPVPGHFSEGINLHTIGVALDVGQVKKAGEILAEMVQAPDFNPERTVVVLPDEQLLLPLLQSLPPAIQALNVTMGFSIKSSGVYSFFEHLFSLYQSASKGETGLSFYYKPVKHLLSHPIMRALRPDFANEKYRLLLHDNLVRVPAEVLQEDDLSALIFADPQNYLHHAHTLLLAMYEGWKEKGMQAIEGECIYHLYTQLNRLSDIMQVHGQVMDLKGFHFLFRQISQHIRLVFEGEPLKGLQVMGILETRLLDFDRVIILSMNEGVLPDGGGQASFIPYHVRKAFDLPTPEHRDAIAAYHVYRLMQRPKEVWALYNTEVDGLNSKGEQSRYLLQMRMEGLMKGKSYQLANKIHLSGTRRLEAPWDARSAQALDRFLVGADGNHRMSASAINNYLYCRLRFYFQYVLGLKEEQEVSEEVDPMVFGTILHNTAEQLYKKLADRKGNQQVELADFEWLESVYAPVLEEQFKLKMRGRNAKLEGPNLIALRAMERYMQLLLTKDKAYAPFHMLGLELDGGGQEGLQIPLPDGRSVKLMGKIDRLDEKDGLIRVLDYKTGKSDLKFSSIASLFDRNDAKRNAYAFQTMLYGMLVDAGGVEDGKRLQSGIFGFRDQGENFSLVMDKKEVHDIRPLLPEFKAQLSELLEEIWSPDKVWDQVEDASKCENCPFNVICDR